MNRREFIIGGMTVGAAVGGVASGWFGAGLVEYMGAAPDTPWKALGAQEGMSCTDCHKGQDMKADGSRGRCPHPQSASRTTRLKGTHKRFIPVN